MDLTERKITKIAREVNKFTIKTLKRDGIGSGEFDVIHVIRKNPGICQNDVSERIGIDKAAIARQVERLEKKGYLIRKDNEKDKRCKMLYPTEKAEELKLSKEHIETLFYEWLMNSLTKEEQESFSSSLDKVYITCKKESKSNFVNIEKIIWK